MTDKRVSQSGVAVVRDGAAAARFSDFGVAAVHSGSGGGAVRASQTSIAVLYPYPGVQMWPSQFGVAVVRSKEPGDDASPGDPPVVAVARPVVFIIT